MKNWRSNHKQENMSDTNIAAIMQRCEDGRTVNGDVGVLLAEVERLQKDILFLAGEMARLDRITRDTQALCAGLKSERDELKQQFAELQGGRLGR